MCDSADYKRIYLYEIVFLLLFHGENPEFGTLLVNSQYDTVLTKKMPAILKKCLPGMWAACGCETVEPFDES